MKHNTYEITMKDGSVKRIRGFSYYDAMVNNPSIETFSVLSWKEIKHA